MTDSLSAEIVQHRRTTRFGRKIAVGLLAGSIAIMFVALGILFHQQESYKRCVAGFFESESQARIARTDASAENTKALTNAFVLAADVIDPTVTPTMTQLIDLQNALDEVPAKQAAYEKAIAKYPYKDFSKVCPS